MSPSTCRPTYHTLWSVSHPLVLLSSWVLSLTKHKPFPFLSSCFWGSPGMKTYRSQLFSTRESPPCILSFQPSWTVHRCTWLFYCSFWLTFMNPLKVLNRPSPSLLTVPDRQRSICDRYQCWYVIWFNESCGLVVLILSCPNSFLMEGNQRN